MMKFWLAFWLLLLICAVGRIGWEIGARFAWHRWTIGERHLWRR